MGTRPLGKRIFRRHQVIVVGIVTWLIAGVSGIQISAEQETFVNCAQQFCGPKCIASNVYRGTLTRGKEVRP
jgi:hypothetical protein